MEPLDLLYLGVAVIVAVIAFCFLFVKFGSPEKKGEQIKQIAEQSGTISVGRLVHSKLVFPQLHGGAAGYLRETPLSVGLCLYCKWQGV